MERYTTTHPFLFTVPVQALMDQVSGLRPLLMGTPHEHTLDVLCQNLAELRSRFDALPESVPSAGWRHDLLGVAANAVYALQLLTYREAASRSILDPLLHAMEAFCHQVKHV
jgi:hypothetical protein